MKKSIKKIFKIVGILFGALIIIMIAFGIYDGVKRSTDPEYNLQREQESQQIRDEIAQSESDKKLAEETKQKEAGLKQAEKEEQEKQAEQDKLEQEQVKLEQENTKKMEEAFNAYVEKGDTYSFTEEKLNSDDEKDSLILTINHGDNELMLFDELTVKSIVEWIREESSYNVADYQKVKIIINTKEANKYGEMVDVQALNYKITSDELNKIDFANFPFTNIGLVGELNIF